MPNQLQDGFSNLKVESPFLDRRQIALQYSETFQISSRAEASLVLKLTQQLSDNLEQYFLKCKGLEMLPSIVCGNKDSCINLGSQSRKRRKIEDPEQIPFISSLSSLHKYDEPYPPTPLELSSQFPSSAASHYTEYTQSLTKPSSHVSKTCDYGPSCMKQNSEYRAFVSQTSSNSTTDVKANSESKTSVSSFTEKKGLINLGMENKDGDLEVTSLNTSSHEPPSCGQTQGKTSKSLSPDILQLLKGKDANTVTNILKTISPFYPALQDVNLEILAQVLVNTGALD